MPGHARGRRIQELGRVRLGTGARLSDSTLTHFVAVATLAVVLQPAAERVRQDCWRQHYFDAHISPVTDEYAYAL